MLKITKRIKECWEHKKCFADMQQKYGLELILEVLSAENLAKLLLEYVCIATKSVGAIDTKPIMI